MSQETKYVCDICGKKLEFPDTINIVINEYSRKRYANSAEEHYCCDFDVCYECVDKYKLGKYKAVEENIEFVKEHTTMLGKIRKLVVGLKQARERNK